MSLFSELLTKGQWLWLRGDTQAIEAAFGHPKNNCRIDRCWLEGERDTVQQVCAFPVHYRLVDAGVPRRDYGPVYVPLMLGHRH